MIPINHTSKRTQRRPITRTQGLALEALHVDLHEVDGGRGETALREDLIEALHLGDFWIRRMVSLPGKNPTKMEKHGEMLG